MSESHRKLLERDKFNSGGLLDLSPSATSQLFRHPHFLFVLIIHSRISFHFCFRSWFWCRLWRRWFKPCFRRRFCRCESALSHQRVDLRIAAAEVSIAVRRIYGIPNGKNILPKPFSYSLVVGAARLGECFESVGVKHVRPQITVVSSRITIAREH